jgi:hypothetical protein
MAAHVRHGCALSKRPDHEIRGAKPSPGTALRKTHFTGSDGQSSLECGFKNFRAYRFARLGVRVTIFFGLLVRSTMISSSILRVLPRA